MNILAKRLFTPQEVLSVLAAAKKDSGGGTTVDSFLNVSLDPEQDKEFRAHFHPKRKREFNVPKLYVEFAKYLTETSAYLEAVFCGLRDGLYTATRWQEQGKDVGAEVSKTIDHYYANAVDKEGTVKRYIQAMSYGAQHIIKPSTRFKGGMDVLFVGQRGSNKSPIINMEPPNLPISIPSSTITSFHKDLEATHAATPIGKAFIETGWKIQELLLTHTELQTLKGAYTRIVDQRELVYIAKFIGELNKLFTSGPLAKQGIAIQLPAFQGAMVPGVIDFFNKYNSVVVVKEPNNVIVNNRIRKTDVPDESLDISLIYQALQPTIAFSFALNLTPEFVSYICQSKDKVILAALNVWASTWASAMMKPPGMRGTGLMPSRAPRYVIMPSMAGQLSQRRKDLGLYTEPGRSNQDSLYITDRGNLAYLPPQAEAIDDNAKEYEKVLEECLALSYEAGAPLITSQDGSAGALFDLASPQYREKIKMVKSQLHNFKGCMQTYSWDLNCIITTSTVSPDRLVSKKLIGCSRPDELNFAMYMRANFMQGMCEMFSDSTIVDGPKRISPEPAHFKNLGDAIETSSLFSNFASAYNMLLKRKLVPTFGELIQRAADAFKVKSLRDEAIAAFEIDRFDNNKSIYKDALTPDLQYHLITSEDKSLMEGKFENTGKTILYVLGIAANDAKGQGRSNLAAYCIKENVDPMDTGRYFEPEIHSIHEFVNLFQYFGGQIFLQAMKAIVAVPAKDLMKVGKETDTSRREEYVGFANLQSEVMPFCYMFSKYITDLKEAIFKKAEELEEANKHPKVSEEELNIAGCKAPTANRPGMQLFPHQAECLSILKNHPRFAVLDIAPGGGKTTLGIADIAMTYADGLISRPFVICPNGLVGNWAEDIHKHMEGRWNVIPVTTETYSMWGDERLTEMIKGAPKNTIVIVGNSFLGNRGKFQLILGNSVENVSDSLEFCKKFHPDYIFIDESHRMRNTSSGVHKLVKSMMQSSSVKFGRIGTGTFIQNVLSDAVGQTALYSAQVFRTKEEFDANHKAMIHSIGGEVVYDYTPDAPQKVRRRLGQFATVISYKRKEWAFMLPLPLETFISVKFEDNDDADLGRQHRMFYDAVLKQTMEELKNDKIVQKLLKGGDSEDDDDDGEGDDASAVDAKKEGKSDSRSVTTKEGTKIEVTDSDDDSDNLDALEAALNPYLQRLERILTDPFGDEKLEDVAKAFFGPEVNRDSFVTAKVKKVIERISLNFKTNEWTKGKEVKSSDIVDYNGQSYIFRPEEPVGHTKEQSTTPPDQDTENWKVQSKGKVIVFCRFTRSVDAIYRALPKELKQQAVIFHGEVEGNKWENLDRFKNDPKINILIANEMGISEGHNLQMASRFIRVESPWAPGELDQSSSRIFRPDPSGKYQRQTIFLDWIICDGTLEVAKMGRLISKMLRKAQFDELDNPKYYKNLNPLNLPIIKMSLDNIKALNKMADLCAIAGEGDTGEIHPNSYIGQYQYLVSEMASEFREMKKTKRSYMIDVTPTPMPDDAKVIEFTPWVANMKVPDRHDEGLVQLKALLQEEENPLTQAFRKDKKALIGQIVRTEFGLGTIYKLTTSKSNGDEDDSGHEISKVWVDLAQGGQVEALSASKVFLATKVTDKTKNALNKKAPKITQKDRERTADNRKEAEKAVERSTKREKDFVAKLKKRPAPVVDEPEVEEEPENAQELTLYPVVYNGYLALEAIPEDETVSLKKYGFSKFGNYAWLPIKTYANFTKVLDFLESKYTLDRKTIKVLDSLHDSFQSGRGRKFDVSLAPMSSFQQFYNLRHKLTQITNKKKPELKLYPVILNGSLMLVVDIATNPVIRKMLGKAIPGTSPIVKFQEADGLEIKFFNNKRELISTVKQLRQTGGFTILNLDELKQEVADLDLKALTGK